MLNPYLEQPIKKRKESDMWQWWLDIRGLYLSLGHLHKPHLPTIHSTYMYALIAIMHMQKELILDIVACDTFIK